MAASTTHQMQSPDPDDVVRNCKTLRLIIRSDTSDADLEELLPSIWNTVNDAFSINEGLKELITPKEAFKKDVQLQGEAFYELLRDVAKRQAWKDLLKNRIFFKKSLSTPTTSQGTPFLDNESRDATLRSWITKFRGKCAEVLLKTIATHLDKRRTVYARCTSIANSSGTGKSRMVDQVAMEIITIPMCLRGEGTKGFPPADAVLRTWLSTFKDSTDQDAVELKLYGFLYSLLSVTIKHLKLLNNSDIPGLSKPTEDIRKPTDSEREGRVILTIKRQANLATAFRHSMTHGQSFEAPNEYRRDFFQEVVNEADEFAERYKDTKGKDAGSKSAEVTNDSKAKSNQDAEGKDAASPRSTSQVLEMATELTQFVDPYGLLDSDTGPRRPLVILAFDESHMLTDSSERGWSLFSELRRALCVVVDLPIFSLFLSTAAKVRLFSPETRSDPSCRVVDQELPLIHPISEISFDDLAFTASEGTVTLDRVTDNQWISHLGRPLFGSYYDALKEVKQVNDSHNRHRLMQYAKAKLLDGPLELADNHEPGLLACLSVRFALDFDLAYGNGHEVAHTQIEGHMRLCVAATTGFEKLITLAGSEPLLAEAARDLMSNSDVKIVQHLAENSSLSCVDRGQRGELVAALIIMRARGAISSRVVSVNDFMNALLPKSTYEVLKFNKPQSWRSDEDKDKPFYKAFEGYSTWFNHVIKTQQSDMISTKHLWKFITRGAMVMCVDNQLGIDIVLPICLNEKKLPKSTVSAILIQVKNNKDFGSKFDKTLFDGMNPFRVGLFSKGDEPLLPVIRLVFALASDEASVTFPTVAEHKHHLDKFTAYDIWCAGLSPDTFRNIGEDSKWYKLLLARPRELDDAFLLKEAKDNYQDEETAEERGRQRRRMAPLLFNVVAHNHIHELTNTNPPGSEDAMDQGDEDKTDED